MRGFHILNARQHTWYRGKMLGVALVTLGRPKRLCVSDGTFILCGSAGSRVRVWWGGSGCGVTRGPLEVKWG